MMAMMAMLTMAFWHVMKSCHFHPLWPFERQQFQLKRRQQPQRKYHNQHHCQQQQQQNTPYFCWITLPAFIKGKSFIFKGKKPSLSPPFSTSYNFWIISVIDMGQDPKILERFHRTCNCSKSSIKIWLYPIHLLNQSLNWIQTSWSQWKELKRNIQIVWNFKDC